MTSASELFYNRRSRLGRTSDAQDLGFESSSLGYRLNHCFNRRHRHRDRDDRRRDFLERCHHLRRRQQFNRSSFSEPAQVQLEQETSPSVSSNSTGTNVISGIRSRSNERLPGAVLLARERLVERLRGVSLSRSRGTSRASSPVSQGQTVSENDSLIVGPESLTALSAGGSVVLDMTLETDRAEFPLQCKKPPGLTQENINHLQVEIFGHEEKHIEGEESKPSWDCSICLERFVEGDELIYLPCGHIFHSACLTPWIRTCGQCPYCRRRIAVATCRE